MTGHMCDVAAEIGQTPLLMTTQQTSTHFLHAVSMQAVMIALYHSFQNDHHSVTHDIHLQYLKRGRNDSTTSFYFRMTIVVSLMIFIRSI